MSLALDDIKVEGRFRKDLGDLTELKESIEKRGLIHCIAVTEDLRLIAGERRLAALRELGWERVPVKIMSNLDSAARLLEAERDENTVRKDMAPTEKAALAKALTQLLAPEAKDRKTGRPAKEQSPAQPAQDFPKGKLTRDVVAGAVGMSARNLEGVAKVLKAKDHKDAKVKRAAEKAAAEMDSTGAVAPAVKKVCDVIDKVTPAKVERPTFPGRDLSRHLVSLDGINADEVIADLLKRNEDLTAWEADLEECEKLLCRVRTGIKAGRSEGK